MDNPVSALGRKAYLACLLMPEQSREDPRLHVPLGSYKIGRRKFFLVTALVVGRSKALNALSR